MPMEKTFNAAEAEARISAAWLAAKIGRAGANAKPGKPATLSRAWSSHASLTYVERVVKSTKVFTFASTFRLTGKQTFVIPDPHIGLQGGEIIKVGERLKEQVVAQAAGWLFRNAVAGAA